MDDSQKLMEVKLVIQEWVDKQGHERCWYYPDLFRKLIEILDIHPSLQPCLPPREVFEEGCCRFQDEEYGEKESIPPHYHYDCS